MVPPDLLDQVDLAQQIDPERRRDDVPAVIGRGDGEPEAAQDALDVGVGDRCAEQPGETRSAQMESGRLTRSRVPIDDRAGEAPGANLLHERDRALQREQPER